MTPSTLEFHRQHKERLARIAHAAFIPRQIAEHKAKERRVLISRFDRALQEVVASSPVLTIQKIVAIEYRVTMMDLRSARRTANVVRPRQIAMYLVKTLTNLSLPQIGRRFGGRDHTTVLHAVRKIEALIKNDPFFASEIEAFKAQVAA